MSRKQLRKQSRVARQAAEIAALAPLVAGARLMKSAATPLRSSPQDWSRFGTEKTRVFAQASLAMMFAGAAAMTKSMWALSTAFSPWGGTAQQRMKRVQGAASSASANIAGAALAPIRQRVVANSRRLGR